MVDRSRIGLEGGFSDLKAQLIGRWARKDGIECRNVGRPGPKTARRLGTQAQTGQGMNWDGRCFTGKHLEVDVSVRDGDEAKHCAYEGERWGTRGSNILLGEWIYATREGFRENDREKKF